MNPVFRNKELLRLAQVGDLEQFRTFADANFASQTEWAMVTHLKSGDNVGHIAARFGHVKLLCWLWENCHFDFELGNYDGKRVLHEAAQAGHVACVKYLLSLHPVVDSLKRADWTPLLLACTKDNIEVVQALISAGANTELRNKDGWNSFHIACREGNEDIIEYLLDHNKLLWNTSSKNERTPLHSTALHGKVAATNILLRRGNFARDMRDSCGTTPFMDAIRTGALDVANALINGQQVDIAAEDTMGRQAVHLAAQAGCKPSVLFLVNSHGVDVNVSSAVTGATPLHVAAKEGQHEMLELLLHLCGDLSLTDCKGRSALHIASGCQHAECVRVLLSHGARDNPDDSGATAASLARTQAVKDIFDTYT